MQVKLTTSKSIIAQMNELKIEYFRTRKENEPKLAEIQKKFSKSEKIKSEIEKIQSHPSYLSQEEMESFEKMIDGVAQLKLLP